MSTYDVRPLPEPACQIPTYDIRFAAARKQDLARHFTLTGAGGDRTDCGLFDLSAHGGGHSRTWC